MAAVEDIVIQELEYDWLDFPFWAEAISHGNKFHSFVAWLADTDAYLCAVVINRKAEFLTMLARIRSEMDSIAAAKPVTSSQGQQANATLPEHWIKLNDPATNTSYYYNMDSGKSQWEFPGELAASSPRSVASPRTRSSNNQRAQRAQAKSGSSSKPHYRDPMAKDPRRKAKRVSPGAAPRAQQNLLHCPSSLLRKQQDLHVHRY